MSHEIETITLTAADGTTEERNLCGGTKAEGQGWHGLLTLADAWTVKSARDFMLADREQCVVPYYVKDPKTGSFCESTRQCAVLIGDPDGSYREIGNVAPSYGLTTHTQILDIAEKIEAAGHEVSTFGSLFNGSRIFVGFKLDTRDVRPGDPLYTYAIATQGIDGSTGISLLKTMIRGVCWNTVSSAMRRSERDGTSTTIKHRGSRDANGNLDVSNVVDRFDRAVQGMLKDIGGDVEKFKLLEEVKVKDDRQIQEFANRIRGHAADWTPANTKAGTPRSDGFFLDIQRAFMASPGCGETGSFWELFNAATYGLTHDQGNKRKGESDASRTARRFSELTLGGGLAKQADLALEVALDMATTTA